LLLASACRGTANPAPTDATNLPHRVIPRYRGGMPEQWKTFLVRVTPEQHAKLERIARSKDRSVAWVIRSMIDRVTEPK
jgi:hypothetical protein